MLTHHTQDGVSVGAPKNKFCLLVNGMHYKVTGEIGSAGSGVKLESESIQFILHR